MSTVLYCYVSYKTMLISWYFRNAVRCHVNDMVNINMVISQIKAYGSYIPGYIKEIVRIVHVETIFVVYILILVKVLVTLLCFIY